MAVKFPTDLTQKTTGLKNEDKLMLGDNDNVDIAKYILLSTLRLFLNFVDTSDTSSTDAEIVIEDGTTGKKYKKSGKFFSTDGTFASNSDTKSPSEKAIKTYVDGKVPYIAYGEIYGHDNVNQKAIPTGAGYTKIDNAFTNDGVSENATPQYTLGQITIPQEGKYRIFYTISYTSDVNNTTWFGAIFLNGAEQNNIHSSSKITSATDIRTSAGQGIISVPANGVIDFRVRHDQVGTVNILPKYININVVYLGDGV